MFVAYTVPIRTPIEEAIEFDNNGYSRHYDGPILRLSQLRTLQSPV